MSGPETGASRSDGISQPSLYHYFPSKEALIREIVEYCAERMVEAGLKIEPPRRAEDLPRFAKDAVFELYASETHPRFVRFLFAVAIERKQDRAIVERVFERRFGPAFAGLAAAFARDPTEREELEHTLRMVVHAIGFALLEERVLFGKRRVSDQTARYAEWIATAAERMLASRPGAR